MGDLQIYILPPLLQIQIPILISNSVTKCLLWSLLSLCYFSQRTKQIVVVYPSFSAGPQPMKTLSKSSPIKSVNSQCVEIYSFFQKSILSTTGRISEILSTTLSQEPARETKPHKWNTSPFKFKTRYQLPYLQSLQTQLLRCQYKSTGNNKDNRSPQEPSKDTRVYPEK